MSLLDDVKARLDIVEVVSGYTSLTQAGRNLKARCPFHSERTPSFVVFPERGSWRCFGACAEGGDAIRFVMKAENQSFSEALRTLADRLGVQLPSRRAQEAMNPLLRANEEVAKFYHRHLLDSEEGADAQAYLEERGVSQETVAAFNLGLSPTGWEDMKNHLAGQGFTDAQMLQAGLLHRSEEGRTRDLFHGRLMFPIKDARGHTVGFGGRELDGGQPKYLNTPQSPLFDKSTILWGMDVASEGIRLKGEAVVVEGYMDALMAHQHGFTNVVASMGTALTTQQVEQLTRLAKSYVLALDADAAGQEATLRSLESSWKGVDNVRIALLPIGKDPDDLIRQAPELWPEVISTAETKIEFFFRLVPPRYDLTTTDGQSEFLTKFSGWVTYREDAIEQDQYMERLTALTGLTRHLLEEALQLKRQSLLQAAASKTQRYRGPDKPLQVQVAAAASKQDQLEAYSLALLLRDPALKEFAEALRPEFFHESENREVYLKWAECSILEELRELVDAPLREHLETLVDRDFPSMDQKERTEALSHCVRRLEERHLRELRTQLGASLSQAQEEGIDDSLVVDELHKQDKRFKELFSTRVRRGY
ncbi:MAG: DNA primase [Chloroflexi bacterium]|nr:DNA primase [Chloroflexota bacterium]